MAPGPNRWFSKNKNFRQALFVLSVRTPRFAQTIALKEHITIKDISRKSRVSTTTVSRVLNGLSKEYRISEETQALVKKIAAKLDYRPNQTAVNLRLKKSNSIGLIVPNLSNPFFSNIASIITHELRKKGYSVILTDSDESEKTETEILDLLIDRRIDGLIVMPSGQQVSHIEKIFKRGLPVMCIDRYFEDSCLPFVATHNYHGAYHITNYLIGCGHKKIACIQGVNHVMPNIQRVKGYAQAMKDAGLPEYHIGGKDFTDENGYLETKLLLQKKEKPTAIFGLSDTITLGAMKALKEESYRVPADVSLVTFDNAFYLDYLAPSITSVVQPVTEIAQLAIKILIEKIESPLPDPGSTREKILIDPRIIYRDSVKRI